MPIPHPRTMLLCDGAVHRELRLRPEQIPAVGAALDPMALAVWRLRDQPPAQRDEQARRFLDRLNEQIADILSVQQRRRLDQLTLQARGIPGLVEPEVADELDLSAAQIQQVREVIAGWDRAVASLQADGLTVREQARIRVLGDQATRNALALLEAHQRRRLAVLTGPSFDLSRVRQVACRAPELRGVETWINSDSVTLAGLRGKVVVVHFYTFGCINCIRNLPHYVAWQEHFAGQPVRIVGIHRPETAGERVVESVRQKAAEAGLTHPIAVDNDSANWDAWANRVWPSVYLIDKNGFIRYWWYGELNWRGTEGERLVRRRIEQLVGESD